MISGFAGTKCETDPDSQECKWVQKTDPSANQISITAGLAKKEKSPKFTDRLGSRSELAALDKRVRKNERELRPYSELVREYIL